MFRRIRALFAVLVVAVLAVKLVVFAPGDEPEAKATLGPLRAVTLTGADFHPAGDDVDFANNGHYLYSDGVMSARIPFPAETVVLTSVKVRVYDNSAGDLCVTLYRAIPASGTHDALGDACTSEAAENLQTLTIPAVFTRVGRYHTAYLWAAFTVKHVDLGLYGATVFYRVVS